MIICDSAFNGESDFIDVACTQVICKYYDCSAKSVKCMHTHASYFLFKLHRSGDLPRLEQANDLSIYFAVLDN